MDPISYYYLITNLKFSISFYYIKLLFTISVNSHTNILEGQKKKENKQNIKSVITKKSALGSRLLAI